MRLKVEPRRREELFSRFNLLCPPLIIIIVKAIAEFVAGQLIFAAGQNVFPRGRRVIAKGQGFEMAAFRVQMAALYGQMAAFRGVMAAFQMDAPSEYRG